VELENSDPEKAEFVKQQVLVTGSGGESWLSEIFANGYGICSNMATAYLWLAERAGLKGIQLRNADPITNIVAAETGDPIFKMTPLGEKAPLHSWNEVYTSSHGWIPVDPTTKLVGDRPEYLATFTDAGYRGVVPVTELVSVAPGKAMTAKLAKALVEPCEDEVTICARAALHEPSFNFSQQNYTGPTLTEYRGPAQVTFHDHLGEVGLKFLSASKA
jgi:hypothetical protein